MKWFWCTKLGKDPVFMKKRLLCIILAVILCVFVLPSCTPSADADTNDSTDGGTTKKPDEDASYNEKNSTNIVFSDSEVKVKGSGVTVEGTTALILDEGTYVLSGSCSDGRVIVEVKDKERVQLVLNGLKLASKTDAPVWVKNCDKVTVILSEGTVNTLEDTKSYSDVNADGEPNACLFSKKDMTINGSGTLNVKSSFNNGITTKDDLKIKGGVINVDAANHGIRGNDSVTITDGTITITCKNDGIKASKDSDPEKGFVRIEGGTVVIDAGDDCLQAPLNITVSGGSVTLDAGGKETNCDGTVNIADGVIKKK